ncbi:MAG: hypothetical protein R3B93_11670 [Bacteroidia bacterium]
MKQEKALRATETSRTGRTISFPDDILADLATALEAKFPEQELQARFL